MIGHLSIGVSSLARSMIFYDQFLASSGHQRVFTGPVSAGYGPPKGGEAFAIKRRAAAEIGLDRGFHLAFSAPGHAAVAHFHAGRTATRRHR